MHEEQKFAVPQSDSLKIGNFDSVGNGLGCGGRLASGNVRSAHSLIVLQNGRTETGDSDHILCLLLGLYQ